MAQRNANGNSKARVSVEISDRRKMELNTIAHRLSEPGDRVAISQLMREAIELYVEQFDTDPTRCNPRERGGFGGIELEIDDGAA